MRSSTRAPRAAADRGGTPSRAAAGRTWRPSFRVWLRSWVADGLVLSYGAWRAGRDSNPPTSRLQPGALPITVHSGPQRRGVARCGRVRRPGTALPTELPEREAPGGTRTRDLSIGVDNRNRSGPQQVVSSRSWGAIGIAESNRTAASRPLFRRDNRAAPARDDRGEAGPPGVEPGPARLELAVLPVTPQACEADDPDRTGLSGVALRCSSV